VGGIPPIFGLAGVRWSRGRFFLDGYSRFAARQDRLSADDLDDPRIPPEGTPGWFTLNLRGGVTLRQSLIVQIACENILDRNYREHGSGVNSPGQNWVISFQMTR
jgi:outer membrane receptor protein involved in Fe transport